MTVPLPWASVRNPDGSLNPEALQADIDELAKAMPGLGGASMEIRFGVSTVTWPGGSGISNGLVVTHGLGRPPVVVVATQNTSVGLAKIPTVGTQAFTTTTFTLFAGTVDGTSPTNTSTSTISWIAIG